MIDKALSIMVLPDFPRDELYKEARELLLAAAVILQ
jgi:hypothetical protein